jgi:hypothetical protein
MRTTVTIVLGFVILIGISALMNHHVNKTAAYLENGLNRAETFIENNQWEQAAREIESTFTFWSGAKKLWAIVINHTAIDNVEISYQRLNRLVLLHEKPLSLSEIGTLKVLIKDVPESENLTLVNIF